MRIPGVDLSECSVCGACVEVCPAVFRIADAGYVEVVELSAYPQDDVDLAIRYCPEDCIFWQEA